MKLLRTFIGLSLCLPLWARAVPENPNTDWFKDARYGVFMYFLPGNANGLALVQRFDVESLANQLEEVGAKCRQILFFGRPI